MQTPSRKVTKLNLDGRKITDPVVVSLCHAFLKPLYKEIEDVFESNLIGMSSGLRGRSR